LKLIGKEKKRVPRSSLSVVLALAEEMSSCVAYGEHDEQGEYLGVDPKIERALAEVRAFLRSKGKPA